MKLFVILAACVAASVAAPGGYHHHEPLISVRAIEPAPVVVAAPAYGIAPEVKILKKEIPIVKLIVNDDHYGNFDVESISADGTVMTEKGHLKDLGDPEGPVTVTCGSYSFIGDDGVTYTVHWTADERGFIATGAHLPVPPPIPEEILKSLKEVPAPVLKTMTPYAEPHVKVISHEVPVVKTAYEAPIVKTAYAEPIIKVTAHEVPVVKTAYEAPIVKTAYEAPIVKTAYEAPIVKTAYAEPIIKVVSHEVPIVKTAAYEAPIVKTAYETPIVKTAYAEPIIKVTAHEVPIVKVAPVLKSY